MTDADVKETLLRALARVAPDVDRATLRGDASLREQADLDSIDFLNFLIEVHRQLGVEVPEADYVHFATLDSAVAYLASRAAPAAS